MITFWKRSYSITYHITKEVLTRQKQANLYDQHKLTPICSAFATLLTPPQSSRPEPESPIKLTTSCVLSICHFAASATVLGTGTRIPCVWFDGFTGALETSITLAVEIGIAVGIAGYGYLSLVVSRSTCCKLISALRRVENATNQQENLPVTGIPTTASIFLL